MFPVIVFFIERNNRNLHVTDSDLFFKTMTRHFSFLFPWGQEGDEEGTEKGKFVMMNGVEGMKGEKGKKSGGLVW